MLSPLEVLKEFSLYEYQEEIVKRLLSSDCYALFVEMGLGKTLIALSAVVLRKFYSSIQRVLVLCPKTVSDSWMRDIDKLKYVRAFITVDVENLCLCNSTEEVKRKMNLLNRLKNDLVIDIINFEKVVKLDEIPNYDMLIVDESTRIKNPDALRTRVVLQKLKRIPYRLILTGSPVVKDVYDLWSQLYLVDAINTDFKTFKKEVKKDRSKWIALANSNIVSLTKNDLEGEGVFKFPEKVYKVVRFELSSEAKALYFKVNEMLKKSIIIDDKKKVLSSIVQLQMITSGFDPFKKIEIEDNRKKKVLGALLKSGIYDPPFVIWASFVNDIRVVYFYLTQTLGLRGAMLYGATRMDDRRRIIEKFQNGEYDFIVAHPVVLGMGATLTRSNVCIYYSNSFRFEDRVQSEDRIHRITQPKDKCYYIDLVAKDTIDEFVLENLKAKRSISSMSIEVLKERLLS
jgi:SNF2 family DNA or RNA helicase